MFRGELPANWREQLAAVLAAEASDGRHVTPESARALEEWIEWWAGKCGLLPGQSNRLTARQAGSVDANRPVATSGRDSGGLPAQVSGQELLPGLPQIDWKSLDASPAPALTYSLPGDPATDLTVLPDSPDAEQMGNWIDMVHFNQRMEERRQKAEAEQQGIAFEILVSAAGMLVEPLDYVMTGWEIYHDPWNLYSYAGLVPGIPAGAGKILKHADEAADVAGAARKIPNPHGRLGGPTHRATVAERAAELEEAGHEIIAGGGRPERSVIAPGYKRRFPDITSRAPDGLTHYENIGKAKVGGDPISREQRALEDIEAITGRPPGFTPLKGPG